MNHRELEKAKVYITSQIVDYIPNCVVSKNILEKLTCNISVLSFDDKEGLSEKLIYPTFSNRKSRREINKNFLKPYIQYRVSIRLIPANRTFNTSNQKCGMCSMQKPPQGIGRLKKCKNE
ncbi:hypothetical protein OWR28_06010 [Chryseobacterium sp. 1B4]